MISWGIKRQLAIAGAIVFIALVIVSVPVYKHFADKVGTCSDGVQNQGEEGIDCGGPCSKVCSFDSKEPLVYFSRIFKASDGVYNAVALLENPNQGIYATNTPYEFKIYGDNDVLLTDKTGNVSIPAGVEFPVFEQRLQVGSRIPHSVSFALGKDINWQKGDLPKPNLKVIERGWSATSTMPTFEANVQNNEVRDVTNIHAVALVYDTDNNIIAASETLIDRITAQKSQDIFFTWNDAFGTADRVQIYLSTDSSF